MTSEGEEYRKPLEQQEGLLRALETAKKLGRPETGGGITSAGRYTSMYYEGRVLTRHPEPIDDDWIERVVNQPDRIEINQRNETIAFWGYIPEFGNSIRVILRERDGTLLNRFPDSREAKRSLRRSNRP